ncbi:MULTISPECIES: NAD(P)-dependent oxidoreductase [unclassified Leisingera]|uniref:NAD(P)-dependent oxidoreductase n=1 Tax=unclassified Leisingera TaxID=2614906 RepID=UPI0002FB52A5|nr:MULTISPECIES: NAD(P)H-binding protein [unclassified Leisingera]KIC16491.1 potassium transporter TrkA [Leisingera sp. ANG-DT]KIC24648.1 potassium transporter TrkA [Leisingera sp. ANG-S3]KIC31697.1 potassium transporter TrkA [Leisingera sp. ANG-S5]KIC55496.1 potassium transporter TrkA [Leisingera sp. ANG-S]KID09228.1 potassium transporter TrkA [Leisingera sp. ANG1]
MKIILFGATGDVGSAALKAAVSRGHHVTAVARQPQALAAISPNVTPFALDLLKDPDAAAAAAKGHDLVISALRPSAGREADLVPLTRTALAAARQAGIPALVTGGAATLKLADGSGHTVLTAPGFLPDGVRPIAEACAAQDALLDAETEAQWTCLRPPAMLAEGPQTGSYRFGTDTLVTDAEGNSQISFADFGAALLDLAEAPRGSSRKLTVAWGAPAPALAAG